MGVNAVAWLLAVAVVVCLSSFPLSKVPALLLFLQMTCIRLLVVGAGPPSALRIRVNLSSTFCAV